jgi:uncharacterized membrane protein YtjA (UPF0391 family)
MLKWIVILVIIALVAGAFGFRGVSAGASRLAGILAVILIICVVVVLLLFYWAGGGVV